MLQKFTKKKNLLKKMLVAVILLGFCTFTNTVMGQTWNISDNPNICCNNVTAVLNQTNGTLTISGKENMADFYDTDTWSYRPPWYPYRSSICTVIIEDGVWNIGDGAFDGCTNLTSVTIASTVTQIGVTSFFNCTSLENLILPANISKIEGGAFRGCRNLTIHNRIRYYPTIDAPNNSPYDYGNEYPFNTSCFTRSNQPIPFRDIYKGNTLG